jgi:hypothetical protein
MEVLVMVLEAFLDTVAEYLKEYLKHSPLSPEDRIIIFSLPFFILPFLVGALKTDSKWVRFLFFASNTGIALLPVLYMKIYDKHDPLVAFLSYSIAAIFILLALIEVFEDLILFVFGKLIDFIFLVLEKLLERFSENKTKQ